MTERAHIREEYKKQKRLPAPEISKLTKQTKEKKRFFIEERLTEEGYKNESVIYQNRIWRWGGPPDREWHKCHGRYAKRKDAEQAIVALEKYRAPSNKFWHDIVTKYEYRIVEEK